MINKTISSSSSSFILSLALVLFLFHFRERTVLSAPIPSNHTSNYALIVSSSRYWFNYRHVINALSIYQLCKANGIPNENIILMLADEIPINARNPFKNGMYPNGVVANNNGDDDNDDDYVKNLYDFDGIEIDYRGEDVTIENMVHVLLGKQHGHYHYYHNNNHDNDHRHNAHTAPSPPRHYRSHRRGLFSKLDSSSNLLIYWTGHGGDEFFKFQDIEEITSTHWLGIIREMHQRKLYNEILFFADTCQAFTLGNDLIANYHVDNDDSGSATAVPNVFVIASSLQNQNSYAHHTDTNLGLSVIERYTHNVMEWIKKDNQNGLTKNQRNRVEKLTGFQKTLRLKQPSTLTLQEVMIDPYQNNFNVLRANVGHNDTTCRRKFSQAKFSDFFANAQQQRILKQQASKNNQKKDDIIIVIDDNIIDNNNNNNNMDNEKKQNYFNNHTSQRIMSASSSSVPDHSSPPPSIIIKTRSTTMIPKLKLVAKQQAIMESSLPPPSAVDWTFIMLLLSFVSLVLYTSKHF